MDLREDIEFLTDDGSVISSDDDDVVDFTPRQVPHWVVWSAAVAVAAGLIVLIAAQGEPKQPAPPPVADVSSAAVSTGPDPAVDAAAGLGDPLSLGTAEVYDAVIAGDSFYVLQNGEVSRITLIAKAAPAYARAEQTVLGSLGDATSSARLVLDGVQHRLWVVVENVPGGAIIELDAGSLRQLWHSTWREPIQGAAALGGHLYLSTPSGVLDAAPGAPKPIPVAALRGQAGSIVADPRRGRVLTLGYAPSSHVYALRSDGTVARASGVIPFAKTTLGVTTAGNIWAGGYTDHGAVLVRLDPHRLVPSGDSGLGNGFGPGAVIVGAGDRSIWVRSGETSGPLWCVDARTGDNRRRWDVTGTVTSQRGTAYVVTNTIARPLVLDDCAG